MTFFKQTVLQWKHALDSRSVTGDIFRKSLHMEMPAALRWAMNLEYGALAQREIG